MDTRSCSALTPFDTAPLWQHIPLSYAAIYLKTLKLEKDSKGRAYPVARGMGFSPKATYKCVYTPVNENSPKETVKARFVDSSTVYVAPVAYLCTLHASDTVACTCKTPFHPLAALREYVRAHALCVCARVRVHTCACMSPCFTRTALFFFGGVGCAMRLPP